MATTSRFELIQDKKGAAWDLALYVPTIIALISVASKLWYSDNQNFTYLLVFLTTLIALIGFNRIAKSRLMIVGSSPIALDVGRHSVNIELRSGSRTELVKEVRFFSDFAGKSFGLTGIDLAGKKASFVFHKGQFASDGAFNDVKALLRVFK
jgi:hypothetical protein